MHLPSRELACGGGCRTAACGAKRTLRRPARMVCIARSALVEQRLRRLATLRLGTRQRGVRGHRGGAGPTPWGRSGQGPRTHDVRPVPFETRQPRLEGHALPDPTASALRAAVEDRRQGPLQARHGRRRPMPAPGCWKCTGATSKVEVVGGRAGLGPRGAGTAHRTTAVSLRVFEGPALNGPPRPRPCTPRWRRADGAWSTTEAAACHCLGLRRPSAMRRKPSPSRPTRDGCTSRHAPRTD
jgi:hypothetical protein